MRQQTRMRTLTQARQQPGGTKRQRGLKGQRGMGMVVTMLVLMGILAISLIGTIAAGGGGHGSSGILGTTDNALQASAARTRSTASFNMAESGLQYTLAWLSTRAAPPGPPTYTNAFAPTGWGFVTLNNRGCVTPDPNDPTSYFAVRIYPDLYNTDTSSATSNSKKYLIESVGISNGVTTTLQAYVRQGSLAQYLVLLNSWNSSGNYWVSGLTTFDGPVHDNNANGKPENVLWKSTTTTQQMFTYTGSDAYTTSNANGISWWKDSFSAKAAPQVVTNADGSQTNQWLDVAAGGAGSIHTGTPVVPFPTSSSLQLTAATNGAATNPVGVTLCPGGGIYIDHASDPATGRPLDVQNMALSALPDSQGHKTIQQILVTQQVVQTVPASGIVPAYQVEVTQKQRVTINPETNTTSLETSLDGGQTWTTPMAQDGTLQSGVTNGVVYCNSNIGQKVNPTNGLLIDPKTGGVHGQIADNLISNGAVTHNNALTIATPQACDANLDGSITYSTSRQIAKDANGNPRYIDVNGYPTSDPTKGTPVYVPEDQDAAFVSTAGTLGLISNNVMVTKADSAGNPLTRFEMDGTVLASGIYDADHYDSRPVGLWENMGGYLSSTVGTFGEFSNSSLQLINGFNTQFNYDARMRNNPPPFFPTTGNIYSIVSWQQVNAPLEP